jgi:hypothetical protein
MRVVANDVCDAATATVGIQMLSNLRGCRRAARRGGDVIVNDVV